MTKQYNQAHRTIEVKRQFLCSDGIEFTSQDEAINHECDIAFIHWYNQHEDNVSQDNGVVIPADEVLRWLRNNQYELVEFYGGANLTSFRDEDSSKDKS